VTAVDVAIGLDRRNGDGPAHRPLTDLGNAERLVARHGRDLRYVPGLDWRVWDGQRWRADADGEVVRRMAETVRAMPKESALEQGDEASAAFARHLLRSEGQPRIAAAVKLASVDAAVVSRVDAFDSDPWLLNVVNGTLSLRSGELHDHRREDLLTKLAPVAYDPHAEAPTWAAFLDRVFAGERPLLEFVQRAVGYSLTGLTTEQVLFLLFGPGANGKSTFEEICRRLLGDYAQQAPAEMFLEQRHSAGGAREDLARLPGARFVAAVETDEGRRLAESLVKQLTGGDTIATRKLYREIFEFKPTFKVWLATNHLPEIRGTDDAIWRRLRTIPFKVTIPEAERDGELVEKLACELPGILRWAVDGCRAWQTCGLKPPEAVADATASYRYEMDVLGAFLDERCSTGPELWVTSSELYTIYGYWADEAGETQLSKRTFGLRLRERGFEPGRRNGVRCWEGVGFKPNQGDA
jgi:putative DNA primase/helicase